VSIVVLGTKIWYNYSMGKAIIDLTGQTFGRLTAIAQVSPNKNRHAAWRCKCTCGKEKVISSNHLRRGLIKSCGCLVKDVCGRGPRPASIIDLAGQIFGKLTVLRRNGYKGHNAAWLCRCKCGKEITLPSNALRSGNTTSCGCSCKGANHPWWKGGVAVEHWGIRNSIQGLFEYKEWRSAVFHRDNFTCQDCGQHGGYLHVHHIKPLQQILDEYDITTAEQGKLCEELWDIFNGVTLCIDCHKKKTWPGENNG
jgi:5-methylcytosine-specific restriction endonuclease McrA